MIHFFGKGKNKLLHRIYTCCSFYFCFIYRTVFTSDTEFLLDQISIASIYSTFLLLLAEKLKLKMKKIYIYKTNENPNKQKCRKINVLHSVHLIFRYI